MKTIDYGMPDRLDHLHQVKALVQDIGEPIWTRAHLALYILAAIDTDDGDWLVYLNRANLAHRKGDMEEYGMILDLMKKEAGYKEEKI